MSTYYLVTPIEFWESIAAQRVSVCQRMKFTGHSEKTEWRFDTKFEALETAKKLGLCMVSETKYSDQSWKYQLLLSTKQ